MPRTFASEIYEGGKEVLALRLAIGHKDVSTKQIYCDDFDGEPVAIRAVEAAERRSAQSQATR
jgi:site-specific recombinase XerC